MDRRNISMRTLGLSSITLTRNIKRGFPELTPVSSWQKNIHRSELLDFLVKSLYGESLAASSIALDRCRRDLHDITLEWGRAQEYPIRSMLTTLYRRVTGFNDMVGGKEGRG